MERNETKRKENELTADLTTKVEKNKKEEKMTTAKKTKQPKATQATMIVLGRLAKNLERTANVGIGYAFCAEHILATGRLG
jgi:exosome complex RNA-binding protein Csl4